MQLTETTETRQKMNHTLTKIITMGAVLASIAYTDADDKKPRASIVKSCDKITIDGKLTEKSWKQANEYGIDWTVGGKKSGNLSEKKYGAVKYTWDANYLYVAYRVFDENIVNLPSKEFQGPLGNRRQGLRKYDKNVELDYVSLFISLDDDHFLWEIDHNASNCVNDVCFWLPSPGMKIFESSIADKNKVIEQKSTYLEDQHEVDWDTGKEKSFTFKTAVTLMEGSTIAKDDKKKNHDKGYVAEMRIPWFSLGMARSRKKGFDFDVHGQVIRLLILVRNGESSDTYHASHKLKPGLVHLQMSNWQKFTLRK